MRRISGSLVGVAVLGLLAVLGLPGPLAAAAPGTGTAPTTLRLTGPSSARVGSSVVLTATLTDASAAPLAGQTVTVESWNGNAWVALGTPTTDASGQATQPVTITATSQRFRAEYAGDDTYAPATSAELSISGTPTPTRLTLTGPRSVVDETTATLSLLWVTSAGQAVPGRVRVYARRPHHAWHLLTPITLTDNGRGQLRVRPRVTTQYQARGPRTALHQGATSATLTVVNKPPMAPVRLPSGAPRPAGLPAQQRAIGAGANAAVSAIPSSVWRSMVGRSWHSGCPVGRSGLRLVRINYWGFDGYRHRGSLVVNAHATGSFVGAFTALYRGQFPIRAMYLPDRFGYSRHSGGANDYSAMRHDDTDAFNCRWVSGNPGVRSPHSYGYAVDINSWENPYRSNVGLLPDSWWMGHSNPRYAWRSRSAPVVRIMLSHGFRWTYGLSDTQHFDAVRTNGGARREPAPLHRGRALD